MTKSKLHLAALERVGKGWQLIPCVPDGKVALEKQWNDPANKLKTAEEVDAYFAAHGDVNIAICPEDLGLAVIDADTYKPDCDVARWKIPDTYEVESPKGGTHYYLVGSVPPTVGKEGKHLGPGIDTRGRGSYVLIPPSVVDGKSYRVRHNRAFAALPAEIEAAVQPRTEAVASTVKELDLPGSVSTATARVAGLIKRGDVAVSGKGGNSRTYQLACELVRDLGLSPGKAFEIMRPWNEACVPPWEPDELATIVTNAASYGQNEAGAYAAKPAAEVFKEAKLPVADNRTEAHGDIIPNQSFPDLNKDGMPRATPENTRLAVEALGLDCRYDVFHDRFLIGGRVIGQWKGELSDNTCLILRNVTRRAFNFEPPAATMLDAAKQLCLRNSFDPVCDYLAGVQPKWDGVKRLNSWLVDYAGAPDTPFVRAVGRIALVAAVRRARQPGCKFDQIIVLEGPEGRNKSTAIKVMAGEENFSDQTILGLDDRKQQELLQGVWLYEVADLTGIHKADVDKVKAFASRTHDRARPAYGRTRYDQPRRCVIFATTNNDNYLQSQTGNRRFWPVQTGLIDVAKLKADRDQLWAEAAIEEAAGASIMLPEELWPEAAQEQEKRRERDPWEDILCSVEGEKIVRDVDGLGYEERISSAEVLRRYLKLEPAQVHYNHWKRCKRIMLALGWEHKDPLRINDRVVTGYVRHSDQPPPDPEREEQESRHLDPFTANEA